jgi:hypothetical protein
VCVRYEEAIVSLKAKVKETEGQDMREAIQDKVGQVCCVVFWVGWAVAGHTAGSWQLADGQFGKR